MKEHQISNKQNYLYPHPLLLKYKFQWEILRFIVINYYLFEAVLASTFYPIYQKSQTQFIYINVILFAIMSLDYLVKFCLTKRKDQVFKKQKIYKLIYKNVFYYIFRTWRGLDLCVLILFQISFIVPFQYARWLRLIILLRLPDVVDFNQEVYRKIHKYPKLKTVYTLFKIMYLMGLFSHYFGCWFQLMDQVQLNQQSFGDAASANQLYYQMNMVCYTPIEQLDQWGRYIYGLYFMASLISTIAYGDIVGKNPIEQIYVTVLMIVSTLTIGLILEQFMNMVREGSIGIQQFITMYNCLRTKMNNSGVSLKTQNKVRSYLVFSQYQQKFHTHQPIYQKLSNRLQSEISYQIFSSKLRDIFIYNMHLLKGQLLLMNLAKKCKVMTFQAQADIYQEITQICRYPMCNLLYKLDGLVEEQIGIPFDKYPASYSSNIYRVVPTQDVLSLETTSMTTEMVDSGKKIFNLVNMLLNFNLRDDDDGHYNQIPVQLLGLYNSISQAQDEELRLVSPPISANPRPFYIQPKNRLLKSIKISSFFMITLQDFQDFISDTGQSNRLSKKLRQIRQQIISKQYPMTNIGQFCSICVKNNVDYPDYDIFTTKNIINNQENMKYCQHLIEECPMLHYIVSENQYQYDQTEQIQNFKQLSSIINQGKHFRHNDNSQWKQSQQQHVRNLTRKSSLMTHSIKSFSFVRRKTVKQRTHIKKNRFDLKSSKIFGNIPVIDFGIKEHLKQNYQKQQNEKQQQSNVLGFFKKIMLEMDNEPDFFTDSQYDPQGINQTYSLEHFKSII